MEYKCMYTFSFRYFKIVVTLRVTMISMMLVDKVAKY